MATFDSLIFGQLALGRDSKGGRYKYYKRECPGVPEPYHPSRFQPLGTPIIVVNKGLGVDRELEDNIEEYFEMADARRMTDEMTDESPIHIGYLFGYISENRLQLKVPKSSKEVTGEHVSIFAPCQFFRVKE